MEYKILTAGDPATCLGAHARLSDGDHVRAMLDVHWASDAAPKLQARVGAQSSDGAWMR